MIHTRVTQFNCCSAKLSTSFLLSCGLNSHLKQCCAKLNSPPINDQRSKRYYHMMQKMTELDQSDIIHN